MRVFVALLCGLSLWPMSVAAVESNIVTGSPTGTYFQIGRDIRTLVAPQGINLQVQPSAGSMENVQAVFSRAYTPLGIVQSDVLVFISAYSDDPELKRIVRKVRMVFPLYNEEVHIVARKGINSLADLADKRVAVGEMHSGTYLTATLLLQQAGVRPAQELNLSASAGIEEMRQGKVDAVFYVAGQPTPLFAEKVTAADDFHLVPITDPAVLKYYEPSRIPGGAYPWQPTEVPVVVVKAILMTYEFDQLTPYLRESCRTVGQIARIIKDNFADLQQSDKGYHPKWQQVDLDSKVRDWNQARCVQEGLRADALERKPGGTSTCFDQCAAETNPVTRRLCEQRCP